MELSKPADQVKVENGITKIAIQHKTEEVTDTHTVTETIHFKYADQSQALPDTIQTITFIRNGLSPFGKYSMIVRVTVLVSSVVSILGSILIMVLLLFSPSSCSRSSWCRYRKCNC